MDYLAIRKILKYLEKMTSLLLQGTLITICSKL
jgi:hypothetical protein